MDFGCLVVDVEVSKQGLLARGGRLGWPWEPTVHATGLRIASAKRPQSVGRWPREAIGEPGWLPRTLSLYELNTDDDTCPDDVDGLLYILSVSLHTCFNGSVLYRIFLVWF